MPRGNYYKTSNLLQISTQPQIYKKNEPTIQQDNEESKKNESTIQQNNELSKKNESTIQQNNEESKKQFVDDSPEMNMRWTTLKYANSSDPNVWGPAFWFTLHNGAARYPIKASPICAERMKGFIMGIPVMIPCEKCQDHATAHIEQNYYRMNEIVSGREQLFIFFVSFHNYVNKRYGKPEMDYKKAYDLYTRPTNVTKLTYFDSST